MHANHGNTTVGTKNSTTGTNGAANGSGVTPPDSVMNGSFSELSLMDVVEVLLAMPWWTAFVPLVVFIVAIAAVHQIE